MRQIDGVIGRKGMSCAPSVLMDVKAGGLVRPVFPVRLPPFLNPSKESHPGREGWHSPGCCALCALDQSDRSMNANEACCCVRSSLDDDGLLVLTLHRLHSPVSADASATRHRDYVKPCTS